MGCFRSITPQHTACLLQCPLYRRLLLWAFVGPIAGSLDTLFGIGSREIELLLAWGPVMYVLVAVPTSFLLDSKRGIVFSMRLCSALVAVACGLLCLARWQGSARYFIHAALVINAAVGAIAMAGCMTLSSEWFPASERASATAIGAQANIFGSTLSFVLGPQIIFQRCRWRGP